MDLALEIKNLNMFYPKKVKKETESASEYMWVNAILNLIKNVLGFNRNDKQVTHVLKNINFNFEQGKIYGILGPNGAGKTTLMKIINKVLIPSTGTVQLNQSSSEVENPICFVGNNDWMYLDSQFNCEENIFFLTRLYGISDTVVKSFLERNSKELGLNHILEKYPYQISAGERQKISLLRGMLLKSVVYLFDEPCDNLDIVAAKKFRNYLKNSLKNKKNIIIYTSHSFEELEEICDEFLFLFNGKMVFSGTKEYFMQNLAKNKEKMIVVSKKRLPEEGESVFKNRYSIELNVRNLQGKYQHTLKGNGLIDIIEDIKKYFIQMNLDMMEFYLESVDLQDMFITLEKLESTI